MTSSSPTHPYADLAGKVAVVTGASRGIGEATAHALAQAGAHVAIVSRSHDHLDRVVDAITQAGGRAIGIEADCTKTEDLERMRAQVNQQLGNTDILVAFAGGRGEPVATIDEQKEHWQHVLEVNLTATFLTIQALEPDLAQTHGSVITMASESGRHITRTSAVYTAAKAGIVALSGYLAHELSAERIRVICLAPSTIDTQAMHARTSDQIRQAIAQTIPLGRLGHPDDIAAATLFLASDASSWISGATLDIAGGKATIW